ncbi:MAG: TIGR01777 family oxidoreductase [Verrucomicrobiota bacterium]
MKTDHKKIVIAGGSGFLGRTLALWFAERDYEVVILSRRTADIASARTVVWDARTLGPWGEELEGATALINMAGRSVNCRYTPKNRKAMMDSRVDSTRVLGQAVAACKQPPPVWLNSSTATIYKHTLGDPHDEHGETGATPEAKDEYSIDVARGWERAFNEAEVPKTRKVTLRTAMVFGPEPGGVFEVLNGLAQKGLGGKMGHGGQYVSWMHADDFCRAMEWLIERPEAEGIYNFAAPNPLTNEAMMTLFRRMNRKGFGLPAPAWLLEVGAVFLRTETELIIKSRRVVPRRLLDEGFTFTYEDMEAALASFFQNR